MLYTPGLSVNFLKKENYSGSHDGMRYYLAASGDSIRVCAYPEPWCFEATPEEQKIWKEFPFSPEGLKEALGWLEETYTKGIF